MSKIEYVEILRTNYKRVLLTKKETANELNISSATIDRLRKNGELNSRKIGDKNRLNRITTIKELQISKLTNHKDKQTKDNNTNIKMTSQIL